MGSRFEQGSGGRTRARLVSVGADEQQGKPAAIDEGDGVGDRRTSATTAPPTSVGGPADDADRADARAS